MDLAVRFENVYKEYPFYQHITAGFKSFLFNLPKNISSFKKNKFIALKDVSFEVRKGETFGIVGRNGSGKSTILGLIAGVIKQDKGEIFTNGKISSLLELGAGFHPELSGIENIILNGIIMGNTRQEMLEKMKEIIDFSELGDFIYQPLRTYSSGMYIRLGFSVAVHTNPDILLIDEALAVGDLSFQEKCFKRIREFKESGATIILVSHDMGMIANLCDRAVWIDTGKIMESGEPERVITSYLEYLGQPVEIALIKKEDEGQEPQSITPEQMSLVESNDLTNNMSSFEMISDFSWWDSPLILSRCEELITGNPDLHFYDFLKKQHNIHSLHKGLCICNRLKIIASNFITYGICKAFDIIDNRDEIRNLHSSIGEDRKEIYDLLLCIDSLNIIEKLDTFFEKMNGLLKEESIIIALEYIGPINFKWSSEDIEIADLIFKFLDYTNGKFSSIDLISNNEEPPINSINIIPFMRKFFEIITIRYFGSSLFNLVFDKIIDKFDPNNPKDSMLLNTIFQFEQILINKGLLKNIYALIIAKTRKKI